MKTIAFKVKTNTDLYNNYFRQKTEKEIFGKLAEAFMNCLLYTSPSPRD